MTAYIVKLDKGWTIVDGNCKPLAPYYNWLTDLIKAISGFAG